MRKSLYSKMRRAKFAAPDSMALRPTAATLLIVFTLMHAAGVAANPGPENEAALLGQQVLAIKAALYDPSAPGAMQAVRDLGLDSRYYVMVRGWLGLQLEGDRDIAGASRDKASHEVRRRIEFLERAIRAIDLEQ
jgi:hypothetical protein